MNYEEWDQTDTVAIFRPYPFRMEQKIFIEAGPRRGHWEVIAVGENKIKLRCAISSRQVEWDRFCYLAWESVGVPWPAKVKPLAG